MAKRFKKIYRTKMPHLEIDRFNMQTLKAIYAKLVRDYVGFFGSLQKLYERGEQRKRIDDTFVKIKRTIALLRNILAGRTISKKDTEDLIADIAEINRDKDYFLEQAQSVQAFRDRVSKVAETTGVSLKDLSVTEEIVRKGARQARTSTRGGARRRAPILHGAMPETRRIVKGLVGGAATAALGPFTPLAGMAYGATKDIFGLAGRAGRFGIESVRERRMKGLGEQLRPLAYGAPPKELEQVAAGRRAFPGLGGYGVGRVSARRAKEEAVAPLMYFFDKKAHKAKWTRTVLKWIKESAKPRRGIFGGLISNLKNLLPLIGAAGLALGKGAGLAGATIFAGLELRKLAKLTGKYFDVLKNVKEFQDKQHKDVIPKIGKKYAAEAIFGKTPAEQAAGKRAMKVIREDEEKRYYKEAKSWGFLTQGVSSANIELWKRGISGLGKDISNYSSKIKSHLAELEVPLYPTFSGVPALPPMTAPERSSQFSGISTSLEVQERLLSAINNVAEEIKKEKELPAIRQTGLGDIHDSSDVLLNEVASGGLTIED